MKISDTKILLLVVLAAFFILYSSVSLLYPTAFGDEGFYAANTRWIAENMKLPVYEPMRGTEIYHEKIVIPPLYEVTQAGMWLLGGETGMKLLIPVFSIIAAAMLYLFLKRTGRPKAGLIAAIIFLAIPSLVTYSVLNYTDTFLTLMFICAAYFGYVALEENDKKNTVIAGIFSGLGFLAKGSGFLVLVMIIFYFLLSRKYKSLKNFKTLLIIIAISGIIIVPWFARSLILYNAVCYHPLLMNGCDPVTDVTIPKVEGLEFAGRLDTTGTEASVWDIGLLNYFNFALGWVVLMLVVFGITGMFVKKKTNLMLISLILVFIPVFFMSNTNIFGAAARAEDTARYTLPMVLALAAIAGIFLEDIFDAVKKYNKVLAIGIIALLLVSPLIVMQQKLETMKGVKSFSEGFFNGCDWIKKNTPTDSIIFSVYAHHTAYFCDRMSVRYLPDSEEIQISNNDTAYEHLKLHGIDYVYIQAFTISDKPYSEVTTLDFLNYLNSSDKFEKILDNTNVYGNSGVILYKVL